MSRKYTYTIFGGGLQAAAAAYDLVEYGDAKIIYIVDKNGGLAATASDKVNKLTRLMLCVPIESNIFTKTYYGKSVLEDILKETDAVLSCLPYDLNWQAMILAVEHSCHFNDLGGNTGEVLRQLKYDTEAKDANVSVVPDCGIAPGAVNLLATYLVKEHKAKDISVLCGGLPQNKDLPLGYKKTFSIAGLLNEYSGKALYIRDGRICQVETLDKEETGITEDAFSGDEYEKSPTSGGSSTMPYSFEGVLKCYDYKTLRWPVGHFDFFRQLKELDLFEDVAEKLDKVLDFPEEKDMLIMSIDTEVDYGFYMKIFQDDNFTAMEKATGFSAAIITSMQAFGLVEPGAKPLEIAIDHQDFLRRFMCRFPELILNKYDEE